MTRQRGNILIGLILGLVLGLGIALGVAVYVTKVPVPFLNKTQRGGAEQDEAEARKNRDWDPNAPLAGKNARPAPGPTSPGVSGLIGPQAAAPTVATPPVPVVVAPTRPAIAGTATASSARPAGRPAPIPAEANATPQSADPLGDLARARSGAAAVGADPFLYFVQAGAFRTPEDAESQRAKLSLIGVPARVTEREQSGRTVYRVRAGPFDRKDDADQLKERLDGGGLEAALVRVQR